MKKILLIILLILLLLIAGLVIYNQSKKSQEQQFLSQLKGDVVFTRRNAEGISDIWKINANGTEAVMLFHNDFGVPYAGCSAPQWSDDGSKIYFRTADKDRKIYIFEMDAGGKNVKIAGNPVDYRIGDIGQRSRETDIFVREGDVYYLDKDGQEVKVYDHKFYNAKFNLGAFDASWSPDKKYIIFDSAGYIMIADKSGNSAKLTIGMYPDWKY